MNTSPVTGMVFRSHESTAPDLHVCLTIGFRFTEDQKSETGATVESNTANTIDRCLVHVVAYCFALHFFFGLVEVLNASNLSYFYYFPATVHIVIAGSAADMYLWLGSLIVLSGILLVKGKEESHSIAVRLIVLGTIVLAIFLLAAAVFMIPAVPLTFVLFALGTSELLLIQSRKLQLFSCSPRCTLAKVGVYLLALFCIIEVSSAVFYVLRPFGMTGIAATGQLDAVIELQLAYAPYGLITWLYLGFLTSCFWIPLVNKLWKRNIEPLKFQAEPESKQIRTAGLLSSILLDPKFLLTVVLAVFIGYYPYFQNRGWLVGTDSYSIYYEPLLQMDSRGRLMAVRQALGGRHPLTLMLLYLAQVTQMGPFEIVELSPVFLTLLVAVASLFFLGGKGSRSLGLMAFLFSVLSVTTAIGLYTSTIANWMILVVWGAFLAFLGFRTDDEYRKRDFLIFLLLSTLMIVIHPWTWGVLAIAILAAGIVGFIQEKRNRSPFSASLMRVVVIDYAFGFLSVTYLTGSEGWRVFNALSLYTYVFRNPSSIFEFWAALNWTTKFWSQFFSPIYIFIAILGVFALFRTDISSWRRRLILSWIFASMIGTILVAPVGFVPNSPASSDSQLWRMLFITPFQVTAPIGVLWISGKLYGYRSTTEAKAINGHTWSPGRWMIVLFSLGIMIAFAPYLLGLGVLLILVPVITAFTIEKGSGEGVLLGYAIQAVCVLIAFNYTARAISDLLLDPHNYPFGNAQLALTKSHPKQANFPM